MAAPKSRWNPFKNWRVTLIVGAVIITGVTTIAIVAGNNGCNLKIGATGVDLGCQTPSE